MGCEGKGRFPAPESQTGISVVPIVNEGTSRYHGEGDELRQRLHAPKARPGCSFVTPLGRVRSDY
jgi:hypothetical protein